MALERLEEDANGDLVYSFTKPWSDGTTGIKLSPSERVEKLAALIPLPRLHLCGMGAVWRRTVCCAARSRRHHASRAWKSLRPAAPHWRWARLLKRVFAIDIVTCPFCHQGALRIIAAITQGEVTKKILRHLKLAADPPPIAPARSRLETFGWVA